MLVAARAIPGSRVVVPFLSKANGDATLRDRAKLIDQAAVELLHPFVREKGDDASVFTHKF
jgi:hypothetical protein